MSRRSFLIKMKLFIIPGSCILLWATCLHWSLKSNFSPKNWQLLARAEAVFGVEGVDLGDVIELKMFSLSKSPHLLDNNCIKLPR
jgi:hypothetical protein